MHWDTTIRLGDVVQIVLSLAAVAMAYIRLRERLIAIEIRLDPLWDDWKKRRRV